MAKQRTRSPNYPSLSLPEAIQKVRQIYDNQHTHSADRATVAVSMGYGGLNGASASAISALSKYGLLGGRADEICVSERAMTILFPNNEAEKERAIKDAALSPNLFKDLSEKFPGKIPSDNVLQNHLLRNGFATSAVSAVIQSYQDTMALVKPEGGSYDSEEINSQKDNQNMQPHTQHENLAGVTSSLSVPEVGKFKVIMDDEFRLDVAASKLGKGGVEKLIQWLNANKDLFPDDKTDGDSGALEGK